MLQFEQKAASKAGRKKKRALKFEQPIPAAFNVLPGVHIVMGATLILI